MITTNYASIDEALRALEAIELRRFFISHEQRHGHLDGMAPAAWYVHDLKHEYVASGYSLDEAMAKVLKEVARQRSAA